MTKKSRNEGVEKFLYPWKPYLPKYRSTIKVSVVPKSKTTVSLVKITMSFRGDPTSL